jgi:hypothetical protein
MRLPVIASTMSLALILSAALLPATSDVQAQQLPSPPNGFRPPPPAPIKPYQPVAAPPPTAYSDASFQAFHKQLADVVGHKDRAALAKLVVAHGFFWVQDKDLADPAKPGIDNLAKAIDLDAKDGSGWEILSGFAADPTAADLPDHKGVVCAPSDPALDPKQFEALIGSTQTDPAEWGYPTKDGVEVHSAAQPNAPVIDKLGLNLVHVLADSAPPSNPDQTAFLHVATPSGKTGFVTADAVAPLGGDQICYTKSAGGWQITGYFGGASQ